MLPYQLKAQTTYELGPEGVRCTIIVPVSSTLDVAFSGRSRTVPESLAPRSLRGRRILVVEDDDFTTFGLKAELEGIGTEVMGPVPDVASAIKLSGSGPRPDAAILDTNLGGEMVLALAERLLERNVPFVFATGYEGWAGPSAIGPFRASRSRLTSGGLPPRLRTKTAPGATTAPRPRARRRRERRLALPAAEPRDASGASRWRSRASVSAGR